ncbi:LuxR family transcriptional regulator [Streptomyces sp. HSG2]|uniref:helix-turn-helix transcriptional regulator n=1 Tax=Streptomyces sp. HSG2 TaxID=2797167 RepID=UPI0019052350|nr:LuxR family transcriptional regulator [Streptomyces sp. HSG2]
MLAAVGLDETCETVYRALLAQPQADLGELREMLALPDAELRKALDRLSEVSLVRESFASPHRFHAVSPEIGFQVLIARQQERLAAEQQRVTELRTASAHLMAEFTLARPRQDRHVQWLDGIDEIRERIGLLVRDVRTEVMTLAPDGAQTAENMATARPQDRALLERGVRMCTVYLDSVRNNAATVQYAEWLTEAGGQVRTAVTLPLRLMILDRRIAVVPTDPENSEAGALILNGGGPLTALCALFEGIWTDAVPLGAAPSPRDRDEQGLSAQQAEVLRLLGQGLTDEAVAKRLGVSPRTARRIAADLMELLGARSRFQAGCRAVAKGWLSGDK